MSKQICKSTSLIFLNFPQGMSLAFEVSSFTVRVSASFALVPHLPMKHQVPRVQVISAWKHKNLKCWELLWGSCHYLWRSPKPSAWDFICRFRIAPRHLAAKCNSSTGEVKGAIPCVRFQVSLDKGSVAIGLSENNKAVGAGKGNKSRRK